MELIRSIKVTIEVDTNKRTITRQFHDSGDLNKAADWAGEQIDDIYEELN